MSWVKPSMTKEVIEIEEVICGLFILESFSRTTTVKSFVFYFRFCLSFFPIGSQTPY